MTAENDLNSAALENDAAPIAANPLTSDGNVPPLAVESDVLVSQSQNPVDDVDAEPLTQPLSQNPADGIEMSQDQPSTELADDGDCCFFLV